MDNFIEILIYLFIIVSFVNSFVKKKKKKEEKDKADAMQKAQTETTEPVFEERQQEPAGKDILEEIQNLFKPPNENTGEEPKSAFEDLWKTESYDEHYEEAEYHKPTTTEHEVTVSEHMPTYSEHTISREKHSYEKEELPEESKMESLMEDHHQIACNDEQSNSYIRILKNELKERDLLKKYVLISEILGKPKALRR